MGATARTTCPSTNRRHTAASVRTPRPGCCTYSSSSRHRLKQWSRRRLSSCLRCFFKCARRARIAKFRFWASQTAPFFCSRPAGRRARPGAVDSSSPVSSPSTFHLTIPRGTEDRGPRTEDRGPRPRRRIVDCCAAVLLRVLLRVCVCLYSFTSVVRVCVSLCRPP